MANEKRDLPAAQADALVLQLRATARQMEALAALLAGGEKEGPAERADRLQDAAPETGQPLAGEMARLGAAVAELNPAMLDEARRYYALDEPAIFLVQAGQFVRLEQFWQRMRDLAREEGGASASLLKLLLELYNAASPKNPGEIIEPSPGSSYDYTREERLGENGPKVAAVLFPGLRQPNGALAVKALVRLGA